MIDSHAHLTDKQFKTDLDDVLVRARSEGIRAILCPGTTLADSIEAREISRRHKDCFWAAGVHPHDASAWGVHSALEIDPLIRDAGILGEIGLDYHYLFSPAQAQLNALNAQLDIAEQCGCSIILHCRNAYDELLALLTNRKGLLHRGVVHCFTGTLDQAMDFIRLGYFLSFGGMLTFRNASPITHVASCIPIDSVLLETDSPYLAPVPLRGKRNEPANMNLIYQQFAQLRHCTYEDVLRLNRTNFHRAFGLGTSHPFGSISYQIGDTLYLNLTNRCRNHCRFCIRNRSPFYFGWHLLLDHEPDMDEIIRSIDRCSSFKEICFCGFGEPLFRAEMVLRIAGLLKQRGIPTRITTSGNLPEDQPIPNLTGQLSRVFDQIEISIGNSDPSSYATVCNPDGDAGICWTNVIRFVRECRTYSTWQVVISVVDYSGVNVESCRKIAMDLGVDFRVRSWHG